MGEEGRGLSARLKATMSQIPVEQHDVAHAFKLKGVSASLPLFDIE